MKDPATEGPATKDPAAEGPAVKDSAAENSAGKGPAVGSPAAESPAGKGPLRDANFLRFWTAVTVSGIGSQVTLMALPLTALMVLHADPVQLGLLTGLQYVPAVVVLPFAGVVADHWPAKLVNAGCDLARGLILLTVPIVTATGVLSLGWLYGLGLAMGVFKALGDVAHHSMLPRLVGEEQLVPGNAAVSTSYSVIDVAGPGLAGLIVQLLGAPYALLVDAVSYLLSASLLSTLKLRFSGRKGPQRLRWGTAITEGFRYFVKDRRVLAFGVASGLGNMCIQAFDVTILIYVVQHLALTPALLGVVVAAGAVGGIAGSTFAAYVHNRFPAGPTIFAAQVMSGIGVMAAASATLLDATAPRVAVLVACMFVSTFALAVYNVHAISARQAIVRPELMGRVTASYRLISHGAIPLGALAGGVAAQSLGSATTVLLTGTIQALLPVAFLLTSFGIIYRDPGLTGARERQA
ncbi:MFS transporter [Streptosporangium sp. NPDC000239]|uniref:MFS transporter n=1 Tax=Streptosporangium sp. NPDC000239 TaxID=3154248 RepID=UPI003317454B